MALREELATSGGKLFRWRSYLPLLTVVLFLVALKNFQYHSHRLDRLWELFCLAISFFGLGIRILTIGYAPKGTSGRTTSRPDADYLNTTGMYSIVRHPLYLGNFFIFLGLSLFVHLWWFSLIVILLFFIYYERIMYAEEEFLRQRFGEEFTKWAEETPPFLPKFRNWRPPDRKFSSKRVLKKEYSGFFAIIATFTLLEIVGDLFAKGRLQWDRMWLAIFLIGVGLYIFIRLAKKKTVLLEEKEM